MGKDLFQMYTSLPEIIAVLLIFTSVSAVSAFLTFKIMKKRNSEDKDGKSKP